MKLTSKGVAHYDIKDPADMKVLVETGLIWKGGPKTVRQGMAYLMQHPDEVNSMVPPEVLAIIQPQPDQYSAPGAVPPEAAVPQPAEQEGPVEQAAPTEEPEAPVA